MKNESRDDESNPTFQEKERKKERKRERKRERQKPAVRWVVSPNKSEN